MGHSGIPWKKVGTDSVPQTTLTIVFVLSYPSRRSKPRNPVLRPAVQWILGGRGGGGLDIS